MPEPVYPLYTLITPSEDLRAYTRQINDNFMDVARVIGGLSNRTAIPTTTDSDAFAFMMGVI